MSPKIFLSLEKTKMNRGSAHEQPIKWHRAVPIKIYLQYKEKIILSN